MWYQASENDPYIDIFRNTIEMCILVFWMSSFICLIPAQITIYQVYTGQTDHDEYTRVLCWPQHLHNRCDWLHGKGARWEAASIMSCSQSSLPVGATQKRTCSRGTHRYNPEIEGIVACFFYCLKPSYFYCFKVELHWLLVEKRIDFNVLLLVYCASHDQAPEYMRDMLMFKHYAPQSPAS